MGVLIVLIAAPEQSIATVPSWWNQRNVLATGHAADDFAAANIGQLKNTAVAAYDELNAHIPQAVSHDLDSLIKSWFQLDDGGNFTFDGQGHRIPKTTDQSDDFAALNLGQLKAVAKLFYDCLITAHYTNLYPWTGVQPDDFALANLGQLKNVFSFDLTLDGDGDGIPDWWENYYRSTNQSVPSTPLDWWELYHFGQFGLDPNTLAPSGDGLTILQKFQRGTDPDLFETVPLDQQSPVRLMVYTRLE